MCRFPRIATVDYGGVVMPTLRQVTYFVGLNQLYSNASMLS